VVRITPGARHALGSWAERAVPALAAMVDAQCGA
jgi:hypothetical protein